MYRYIFQTGRAAALCQLELDLLLAPYSPQIEYRSNEITVAAFTQKPDWASILSVSGGIVKIAECIDSIPITTPNFSETIRDIFIEFLKVNFSNTKKVIFGISYYGRAQFSAEGVVKSIKSIRAQAGNGSQFVLGQGNEISSVQVEKEGLLEANGIEFVITQTDTHFVYGRTIGVQNFERWSTFDYGRPGRDAKSGLLPPKVARMMVNLGLQAYLKTVVDVPVPIVYDPFCGSGTVLTESMQLGCSIVGSDNSPEAIEDTRRNIEWTAKQPSMRLNQSYYSFSNDKVVDPQLFVSDSVHVSKILGMNSVDVIVTEPYMGPPFREDPTPGKRERVLKGLEKLFIGSFKEFGRVLKPGGVLVFAEPEYFMQGKSFKVGIIDKAAQFGYTQLYDFVQYKRDHAFVGRRIAILKKL